MSAYFHRSRRSKQEEARNRTKVARMFARADKNGDGKLSKEEWYRVLNSSGCRTTMGEVEEFFNTMDRDFDGKISFEELMGEETPLEKVFKSMDKDGDGVVTKEEFVQICKNLSQAQVTKAFLKFDTSGDDRLDFREFCEMVHSVQDQNTD